MAKNNGPIERLDALERKEKESTNDITELKTSIVKGVVQEALNGVRHDFVVGAGKTGGTKPQKLSINVSPAYSRTTAAWMDINGNPILSNSSGVLASDVYAAGSYFKNDQVTQEKIQLVIDLRDLLSPTELGDLDSLVITGDTGSRTEVETEGVSIGRSYLIFKDYTKAKRLYARATYINSSAPEHFAIAERDGDNIEANHLRYMQNATYTNVDTNLTGKPELGGYFFIAGDSGSDKSAIDTFLGVPEAQFTTGYIEDSKLYLIFDFIAGKTTAGTLFPNRTNNILDIYLPQK